MTFKNFFLFSSIIKSEINSQIKNSEQFVQIKILDKISEESAEVIKAAKDEGNDKIIHEVADLWFHTLVLLRHKNISIKEIETELIRRFGVSGHAEKATRNKSNEEKSN